MAEYNHDQSLSSASWVIIHNLGVSSVVTDVFIVNGPDLEKVLPLSVVHTDNNTLTVTFTSTQIGKCRIIG